MTLLICGMVWLNPITHEARRACMPSQFVSAHRPRLPGDRRALEVA